MPPSAAAMAWTHEKSLTAYQNTINLTIICQRSRRQSCRPGFHNVFVEKDLDTGGSDVQFDC